MPSYNIIADSVCNSRDSRSRDIKAINLRDLFLNIAIAHSFGVQRYNNIFDAINHVANRYLVLLWYLNDVEQGGAGGHQPPDAYLAVADDAGLDLARSVQVVTEEIMMRMAKIQTRSCTWTAGSVTASRMKVISATPVTP